MAVMTHLEKENVWILDHKIHLQRTYSDIGLVAKDIFEIRTPFYMDLQAARIARQMAGQEDVEPKRKKVKLNPQPEDEDRKYLERVIQNIEGMRLFEPPPKPDDYLENNAGLRKLVAGLETCQSGVATSGKNDENKCQIVQMGEAEFAIPPNCRYVIDDVVNFGANDENLIDEKFGVILMDPPWENKHIKRLNERGPSGGYNILSTGAMLPLLSKVVLNCLEQDTGILLMWCTNSKKQQEAILNWTRSWNLSLKAKWFWLKVTKSGAPITEFSGHKSPYEMIWIFSKSDLPIPDKQVLVSVPSGVHSHKPPLTDVLSAIGLVDSQTRCLELFGRYLLPGWTTFGNEALKFQNLNYFKKSL